MNEFIIYNYFPNSHIRVDTAGRSFTVGFQNKKGVPFGDARKSFSPGQLVRIYISPLTAPENWVHLCTYKMHHPIRALHIGQVTTRFSGGTWDDQLITSSNAVQGRPYLHIHNATNLPLRLNNNIRVEPNSMFSYSGRHHFGVPLGLKLSDIDRRYPSLQLTKPVTDLYYGIVSEKPQPIYGGWQKVFSTANVNYSTYYDAYGHVESL